MTPASSEAQLHPRLTILVGLMTPFHVRDGSRAAPCVRAPQLLAWRHRSECELAHGRQPKGARRRGGRRYCMNARTFELRDFLIGLLVTNNLLPMRLSLSRHLRCAICPGS